MDHATPAGSQWKTCWQGAKSSPNANQKSDATGETDKLCSDRDKGRSQELPRRVNTGQPLDTNSAPAPGLL